MSLTFIVVFGFVGVLVTAGALVVIDAVPWLAIVIGVGLTVAGVAMLRGWRPSVSLPQRSRGVRSQGMGGVLLFGASYAVASLAWARTILGRTQLGAGGPHSGQRRRRRPKRPSSPQA